MAPIAKEAVRTGIAISVCLPLAFTGAQAATLQSGAWQRLFARDVERMIGRAIFVDTESITTSGTTRSYRQADVLSVDKGTLPKGTTLYYQRSVNCSSGLFVTRSWSIVSKAGVTVKSGTLSTTTSANQQGDTVQGKVLTYVCKGIKPR